jgi:hypothetical protein
MRKECLLLTFFLALPACAEPPPPAHPVAENTAAKEKHAKFERKLEAARKALAGGGKEVQAKIAAERRGSIVSRWRKVDRRFPIVRS